MLTADIAIVIGATILALTLRLGKVFGAEYLESNLASFVGIWAIFIITFYIADLYNYHKDFRSLEQALVIFIAIIVAFFFITFLFYALSDLRIGRGVTLLFSVLVGVFIILWRWFYSYLFCQKIFRCKVLIVGAGKRGQDLLQIISVDQKNTFEVVGFLDDDPALLNRLVQDIPVLGGTDKIVDLVEEHNIEQIILAIDSHKRDNIMEQMIKCSLLGINVIEVPDFYGNYLRRIPLEAINLGWLYTRTMMKNSPFYYYSIKRVEDLILAVIGLILSSPILLLAAVIIKLDSKGPVFYRQSRMGMHGEEFNVIKFRTMVDDAESGKPVWSGGKDSRITRIGRFLRKSRLDEIPQLLNVIRGEMSIVGPRPEREYFVQQFLGKSHIEEEGPSLMLGGVSDNYNAQLQTMARRHAIIYSFNHLGLNDSIPYYASRLFIKPGITGWAQINYGYVNSEEGTRKKLEYDIYYLLNQSLILDLQTILQTVKVVLMGKGT